MYVYYYKIINIVSMYIMHCLTHFVYFNGLNVSNVVLFIFKAVVNYELMMLLHSLSIVHVDISIARCNFTALAFKYIIFFHLTFLIHIILFSQDDSQPFNQLKSD